MLLTKEKTNRHEQILSRLIDLTYATADQLKIINNLSSDRNARRILYEMEQSGYIKSVQHIKKIYYATNKGSDFIGRGNTRLNKREIDHTLMRNDLYIKLGMPVSWQKESRIVQNEKVILISDARFKRNGRYYFVEIDNKQSMKNNYEKIKKYSDIFKAIYRQEKQHPKLIWYIRSELRKEKIIKACQKHAINYEIY